MLKKTVVIKQKKLNLINFDYKTLVLFSLFLCGVILGIFIIKNCDKEIENAFCTLIKNFISAKSESNFIICFSGMVIISLVFLIFAFLFGMCAIGTPLVWCLPVIFGIFCSSYVSLLLISFGIKGFLYCVLFDLLPYAITTATLVRCCCESTELSVSLFGCIAGDGAFRGRNIFKKYTLKYIILCIPVVLSALISTICFKIFQGLFIFV